VLLLPPDVVAQYDAAAPQDYPTSPPAERDWSQDEIPAHLAVVDGEVTLERDGRAEAAAENIILLAGDRLRTSRGRAEVLFADGSALSLDEYSGVDLLSDALVRMLDGRLRLSIARGAPALDYRVDTAAGSVFIKAAGDYRLTLAADRGVGPELDLAVLRGSAELANEYGRTLVRAGTHALASTRTAPSLPFPTNSAAWDSFDRWVEDQRQARLGVESARYLPDDLHYYGGAFDRYGSWGYEPTYGHVWYPRVSYGWRPYWQGRWSFVGHFGWVWIGVDRWSWPTHHYGRWGYRDRWFWIPERRWSPAWVSWAYAPGYVSWCPLGWDNRPVISITNIHVTRIDPWIGWTVVPRHSFRPNAVVTRYAVARQTVTPALWSQFAVQRGAPARPAAVAIGDNVVPLRAPTARFAVSRAGVRAGDPAPSPSSSSRTAVPSRSATTRSGNAFGAPSVNAPGTDASRRAGSSVPRLTAPRDTSAAAAASRAQSRAPAPRAGAPPSATPPSRAIRSREPVAPPSSSEPPSRTIRSREPSAPSPSTPSRSIRSREPAASSPPSSVSSPSWGRSRAPQPQATSPSAPTSPSRAIRSREPAASPPSSVASPSSGRSRAPQPQAAPPPAPRSQPPSGRPGSGWSRPPSTSEPRAAAPSRQPSSRPPSSGPPPSSSSRSSGGWGSPSRGAPRSGPPPSTPAPSASRPSRGGGEGRAPAASSSSSGNSRGGASRRGGGR
jgi:hypothetical protein